MIGEGGKNTWQSSESSEEENASDVEVIEKPKPTKTKTVIKLGKCSFFLFHIIYKMFNICQNIKRNTLIDHFVLCK